LTLFDAGFISISFSSRFFMRQHRALLHVRARCARRLMPPLLRCAADIIYATILPVFSAFRCHCHYCRHFDFLFTLSLSLFIHIATTDLRERYFIDYHFRHFDFIISLRRFSRLRHFAIYFSLISILFRYFMPFSIDIDIIIFIIIFADSLLMPLVAYHAITPL
jgi:hypothetical protein